MSSLSRQKFDAWFSKTIKTPLSPSLKEEMFAAWKAGAAQAVPLGWVLAPIEPPMDMALAGWDYAVFRDTCHTTEAPAQVYRRMLQRMPKLIP